MKALKRIALALIAATVMTLPAAAQFKIGPRIGMNVNSMKFNESVFKSDNRAGFTAGLQAELMLPVAGIGFDASVMYVHRYFKATENHIDGTGIPVEEIGDNLNKRDYIEIPINLKWKIGVPLVGNIIRPYLFTGPSFAFLTSKKAIDDAISNKSVDVAWNFGFGVELIKHLQIGASYGLGLTNTLKAVSNYNGPKIDGKNRYWTVTAAWLF